MQSKDMDHPPSKQRRRNMDSFTTQEASSSSSSSATRSWTHDVFLSFRGEDTRDNFTDHLHSNLVQEGIKTFRDDKLTKGEEISQALFQAIEGSKSSLIVFSENYASSKWCLDELVHILKCKKSNQQIKVWAVFYKVDPSDVRHQRGSFADALAKHERNFKDNMDKVSRWRTALSDAASLSGWHFSGGYESKFIQRIVEEISAEVKEPTYLDLPKCQVGLDSRVQDMLEHLDVGGIDIRMVGIWGTGGIGKTTIAKSVYNSIAHNFERSCFLASVREESKVHGGLLNLQNILLKIVGGKELMVTNVYEGITLLNEKLRHKKILLVLDDVNKRDQLDKLAGATDWFGRGSRIIITTRDKHVLDKDNPIYKVRELHPHEACKLFSSKAFKNKTNLDDNEKLSLSTVVEYAQGLPLALEVLGSCLCGISIHKWQAMLDGYKINHPKGIREILTISYDGLEEREQKVFLDIACFFKGRKTNDVIQILEGYGRINPEHSIQVLEEKAVINVGYGPYGYISMHDLLEEMGKEIVHQQSPNVPGERSRLWYHKDVHDILTKNSGTSKIEGIMVKLPRAYEICLSPKCFKKMKNLKIFINVNAWFCGKVDYLPGQLRFLEWPKYPLQTLPSNFNMEQLVQLNMPDSCISRLGKGFKRLQNLKSMNFTGCEFLTEIPNLSGCPNLERMDLRWCRSLVEVHPSVGFLEKLVHLDLNRCYNLVKLPRKVNWRSLRYLDLGSCRSLESFPEIVGEMKCLTKLFLHWCSAIKELPSSIEYLINLEELRLVNCENLTNLPCNIYQLQNLKTVSLEFCPKLITFPNKVNSVVLMPTGSREDREFNIGLTEFKARGCSLSDSDFLASLNCASTLTRLDLSRSNIVSLSECLCKFICLGQLDLSGCRNLVEIPQLPPCIKHLDVWDCVSLERISNLSKILEGEESQMIEEMNLTNCWRLIENLVKEANVLVNDEDYEAAEALFPLFLSCQQSKFRVRFPGSEIPKWFSCQMDFQGLRRFEFYIEILPNFKWENTGLALCVDSMFCNFEVFIYINEVVVLHLPSQSVDSRESPHVWLQYIPFVAMWRLGYLCTYPLPPFMCRVIIFQSRLGFDESIKSCGVHLVMPPNENVCMKLSRAENITSDLPEDIYTAVPPPVVSFSAVLTTPLVNATPEQRRTMLGEKLYPLVEMWEKDKTAKVTGMLLEMENTEILHLLDSPEDLRARVADAMDVLQLSLQMNLLHV